VRAAEELRRHRERTGGASVLFLDEPTVFLPEEQVEFLFELVRTVVADGSSVVFISHDLAAVRAVADRATVLRDGRVAGHVEMSAVSDRELVDLIVGQGVGQELVDTTYRARRPPPDRVACTVTGLRGGAVAGLDVAVRPGEVVGLAGLLGSGAEDVPYQLFGARPATGALRIAGDTDIDLGAHTPAAAIAAGIALVPAERRRDAIAPALDVGQNMMLLVGDRYMARGRLRLRRLRDAVRARLDRFDVRPRDPGAPMRTLSGGNQQKVVLAKWLEIGPRLLLLHEPTQGVDIAARAEIYRLVRDATEDGTAVLWVSSDHDELAAVCDRVHVIADGRAVAELAGDAITAERVSAAVYDASIGSSG
jgi:ribose transport system ATP-binding protein